VEHGVLEAKHERTGPRVSADEHTSRFRCVLPQWLSHARRENVCQRLLSRVPGTRVGQIHCFPESGGLPLCACSGVLIKEGTNYPFSSALVRARSPRRFPIRECRRWMPDVAQKRNTCLVRERVRGCGLASRVLPVHSSRAPIGCAHAVR
jgi:hypothetical protein